jgi:peptidoglycan hydrolase-like protein with peptidoglycan-binding domain
MTDGSKSRVRATKSVVLVGTVLIALGAMTGVTLSQAPDRPAQQAPSPPAQPTAPPVVDPALPAAEPPPEPTSADFARPTPAPEQAAPAAPPPAPAIDWTAMPIDQLRTNANANDIPAMEELARRLVQGIGVPKDQQAGAGWMLRAAQRGSAQSAFNVGVMYERGFVVERDSTRAVEWYRKAAEGGMAMAKHNLALMLREGKGAPRDGKEAIELLRSAARQGMSASMFTLGDIYERGDVTPKDQAMALAWFAITAEFESQANRGGDSQLGKTAAQRAATLKRILLPGELERAQQFGQAEFKEIVATLQPAKPPATPAVPAPSESARPPSQEADPPGWPKSAADQIRAIQQALLDLRLVRDKPDGALGPVTRAAIRSFQRSTNLRQTGDPTKDVYVALKEEIARRDGTTAAKTETKPKSEAATETAAADQPKPSTESAAPPAPAESGPPGWPKAANEQGRAVQQALVDLNLLRDKPDGEIGPQTRNAIRAFQRGANLRETGEPSKDVYAALMAAIARRDTAAPKEDVTKTEEPKPPAASATEPGKAEAPTQADPPGWPKAALDQVKAIQQALLDLNLLRDRPDGEVGPATRDAIKRFQRSANLNETGEPTRDVYSALQRAVARRNAETASDPTGWPRDQIEQVKAIQQALVELNLLRDRPDGDIGPLTRDAIRTFQRSVNLRETGEPTKDVYAALQEAITRRTAAGGSKAGPGQPTAAAMIDPAETKADPNAWPAAAAEQIRAIQRLLRELNFTREEPDGLTGPLTSAAIREYQSSVGLAQTGEPSRELFESLKEMRRLTGGKPN